MENRRAPVMLQVMSILMIIAGALGIFAGLIGSFAGGVLTVVGAVFGSGVLASLGILIIVLSLAGGVLQLVSGINSVSGRHLDLSFALSIVFVAASTFVVLLLMNAPGFISTLAVFSLILDVVYLLSIVQARTEPGQCKSAPGNAARQ